MLKGSEALPPTLSVKGKGWRVAAEGNTFKNSIFATLIQDTLEATESTRQKKVARLIQKEVAEIFLRKGSEFAPGKMISITKVRVSPDLSFAKIFISIFPSQNHDEILVSIQEHAHKIRFELGHKVRSQLRIVPEIVFHIDDSLDYIDKIDRLLKS